MVLEVAVVGGLFLAFFWLSERRASRLQEITEKHRAYYETTIREMAADTAERLSGVIDNLSDMTVTHQRDAALERAALLKVQTAGFNEAEWNVYNAGTPDQGELVYEREMKENLGGLDAEHAEPIGQLEESDIPRAQPRRAGHGADNGGPDFGVNDLLRTIRERCDPRFGGIGAELGITGDFLRLSAKR